MDKEDIVFLLVLIAVCVSMIVQCYHPNTVSERARVFYDCRLAEISPDVPPLVKQECRKMQEGKK